MQLSIKADRYQFMLVSTAGEKETILGHYSTVLTLLEGARRHLRKDRSKRGQELRAFIENGIAHEEATLCQLRQIANDFAVGIVETLEGDEEKK